MKCIEDEIPFELPEGWVWERMGNISTIARGGSPRPIKAYLTTEENGINWIKISDTEKDGKYIFSTKEKIKPEGMKKSRYVQSGDFLLTNSMSFGRPYILKTDGCIHDGWLVIGNIESIFNQDYLYYALSTNFMYQTLSVMASGSTVDNLNSDLVKALLFPIPPMNEQMRIAQKVEELLTSTKIINENEEVIINNIKKLKTKILDLAIRGKLVPQNPDDEPASILLERIRAEKEELINQGKIKRDKKESVIFKGEDNSYYRTNGKTIESCDNLPFDLPEGWIWTSLGQYCEKVTDQVASGSFAALRENVVSLKEPSYALMVKTADFSNGFTKNLTYTDKHGYEFLENSNLFGGELILSNIGSIGKVFIVPDLNCKMTLAPNSVMIRLTNNEYRDYLYYFLQSPTGYEELKAISTGVAMLKFNKTDLKTIYLPSPPLAEQKRIINTIEALFAQIDKIAEQIS